MLQRKTPKFIISIIGLLSLSSICNAQEAVFTTYPNNTINQNKWIIEDLNPGKKIERSITVENLTNQKIELNITFKESSGSEKHPKIIEDQDYKNIGNWIKINQTKLELQPHQKESIPFTIEIPDNVQLGKYQGSILVNHLSEKNPQLKLNTRIGNRIYLNITDNPLLESNTTKFNITTTQIILIIISSVGLIYGLLKTKTNE